VPESQNILKPIPCRVVTRRDVSAGALSVLLIAYTAAAQAAEQIYALKPARPDDIPSRKNLKPIDIEEIQNSIESGKAIEDRLIVDHDLSLVLYNGAPHDRNK
jgi:hypothetical protein